MGLTMRIRNCFIYWNSIELIVSPVRLFRCTTGVLQEYLIRCTSSIVWLVRYHSIVNSLILSWKALFLINICIIIGAMLGGDGSDSTWQFLVDITDDSTVSVPSTNRTLSRSIPDESLVLGCHPSKIDWGESSQRYMGQFRQIPTWEFTVKVSSLSSICRMSKGRGLLAQTA